MILKFKSRKDGGFRQAIEYVTREGAKPLFVMTHNMQGAHPEEWEQEFAENESGRKRKQVNNVKLYHIILSWHFRDSDALTPAQMKHMTRKFISLYNPHALYVAVGHPSQYMDSADPQFLDFEDRVSSSGQHVHILASGVDKFGRSIRLSKAEFAKLKKDAEDFQRQQYPELVNSLVGHGKFDPTRQTDKEYWARKRTKGMLIKDKLLAILNESYEYSRSFMEFWKDLKGKKVRPYFRNDKLKGVEYQGKKYRLKRLGFEEHIRELEKKRVRERSR